MAPDEDRNNGVVDPMNPCPRVGVVDRDCKDSCQGDIVTASKDHKRDFEAADNNYKQETFGAADKSRKDPHQGDTVAGDKNDKHLPSSGEYRVVLQDVANSCLKNMKEIVSS